MKELLTSKWVTVKRYCEMSGDTAKAVYARRSKGVWAEGVHAKHIPGIGVMINLEEINKWIEGSQLESQ